MNTSDIRARICAVLVGIALLFFEAAVPSQWFGNNLLLLFVADITIYSIAGLVLGFIWPNSGWRLGFYLAAVWPLMLLFGVFLAWEQRVTERATWLNLLGYLLVFMGACAGAGLGALLAPKHGDGASAISAT